jgi:MOSC domain-containing protein YiiM
VTPDPVDVRRQAYVVSLNVGRPREVVDAGRTVVTAIWKSPVEEPVAVRGVNLEGDDQADRTVHGGPDKAVYAYASEDYAFWEQELDQPVPGGTFGENITTAGLDLRDALVGERWRVGSVVLEVSQPRMPCFKLGIRMGSPAFPRRFSLARRPGTYLRIVEEGELVKGDRIDVIDRPGHGIGIIDVFDVYYGDHARAGKLLGASQLPESWRQWAESRAR